MSYKFRVSQIIENYTHVDDDYRKVEVTQNFECNTFDELQDLILTLVDYSAKNTVRFEVFKEEVNDVPMP